MSLGLGYQKRLRNVKPHALCGYWPLDEYTGATAYDWGRQGNNGTYTATTLGSVHSKPGRVAPLLDGSTSYINVYSAAFIADVSTTEGTVMAWCRVKNNGIHSDSTVRRILSIGVDANNVVLLEKTATANTFRAAYIAGSTTKSVSPTIYENSDYDTQWFHFALTYSVTGDAVKVYVNGAQSSTTQSTLGTWSGTIASTICLIGGSATTPSAVWSGYLSDVAVWNEALTDAEIELLAKVAG